MTFWLSFSPSISDTPHRKLVIKVLHDALTEYSVQITAIDGDNKKDILHVSVDLTDKNFFKTHFTWSTDAFKSLVVSSYFSVLELSLVWHEKPCGNNL